jgi:hypothetical protein
MNEWLNGSGFGSVVRGQKSEIRGQGSEVGRSSGIMEWWRVGESSMFGVQDLA